MMVSCCIIFVFAVFVSKVSLQVVVKHFVGESAVLPCVYTADKNQVQTVNWLYDDKKNVCEFSPFGISKEVKYDERAESFPEAYENGNYSIKIKKLEKTDQGEYTCIITPADHFENMHLIVEFKGDEEMERSQNRPAIIAVIVLCCVLILTVVILKWKKMCIFKRR